MRLTSHSALLAAVTAIFCTTNVAVAQSDNLPPRLQEFLSAHPVEVHLASAAPPVKDSTTVLNASLERSRPKAAYDSVWNRCPERCDKAGTEPTNWTAYHDVSALARCNETTLLAFNLYTPLDDPDNHVTIRSCAADLAENHASAKREMSCLPPGGTREEVEAPLQMAWAGPHESTHASGAVDAVQQIQRHVTRQHASCNESIIFASSGKAVVGLYAGSQIQSQGLVGPILHQLVEYMQSNGAPQNLVTQLCATHDRNTKYSIGIIASTTADLASVQSSVSAWRDAKCVTEYDHSTTLQRVSFLAAASEPASTTAGTSNASASAIPSTAANTGAALYQRSTCSTIQVRSGDSCGSLAAECGISGADFTKYNSDPDLCSTLAVGQHVCCSPGTLPDFSPSPDADGNCATKKVHSDDTCETIAAANTITVDDIKKWNADTWGWMGCRALQIGSLICLSEGYPPMPAPLPNAVCGPQVPGTPAPSHGTDLSTLNECPLNACCDIWGQCGTTAEFCTISNSTTGAPGTAAPKENGCISNCGTKIVRGDRPNHFRRIGFFEGFDLSRPCLRTTIKDINTTSYTHIHYSFATLTPEFDVNIDDVFQQFQWFVSMTGVKRILSFGGWTFSTSPESYQIFREAVRTDSSRTTTVKNIFKFMNEFDLDGVSMDWEYPGEPDIHGIPASSDGDAVNYFLFMNELSNYMRKNAPGKTLATTAPASYWYLKNIPIEAVALVVDYVVFMTYDLHGQWDYGNPHVDSGCPAGNCLRSDVNLTQTLNSLSMITKANVDSNKIAVGITSYGRAFEMTTPGCHGPMCTYTGPESGAIPGACTGTPGYLANGEINNIIAANPDALQYLDDSYSNILVYDDIQWVSYMDSENKATRTNLYLGYHFGGTADWAIDLQSNGDAIKSSGGTEDLIYLSPEIWDQPSPLVVCNPPCTLVQPPLPLPTPEVVTWPDYVTSFYTSLGDGSISTVTSTYSVPPFTLTDVPVWPITISKGDPQTGTWVPLQSIMPPGIPVELPPQQATIPPEPYTFSYPEFTPEPTSTSSTPTVAPFFFGKTYEIELQPQPTVSITVPPAITNTTVTYHSESTASPTTTAGCDGCGSYDSNLFGDDGGCGLHACNSPCGTIGCGGGCGLGPCIMFCPPGLCSGGGGGGGVDGTTPADQPTEEKHCSEFETASYCVEVVSSYSTSGMSRYSTVTTTDCMPTIACTATPTTTTATKTTSYAYDTITAYFWNYLIPTANADELSSVASAIASRESEWDAKRWPASTTSACLKYEDGLTSECIRCCNGCDRSGTGCCPDGAVC